MTFQIGSKAGLFQSKSQRLAECLSTGRRVGVEHSEEERWWSVRDVELQYLLVVLWRREAGVVGGEMGEGSGEWGTQVGNHVPWCSVYLCCNLYL